MVLIECSECSEKVSETSVSCVHCGSKKHLDTLLVAPIKKKSECPECSKKNDSNLETCPQCGFLLDKHNDSLRKRREWLTLALLVPIYLTSFLPWPFIMLVVWSLSFWAASAYHSKKISEYRLRNKTILAKDSKGLSWMAFGVFLSAHVCLVIVYTVLYAIANS